MGKIIMENINKIGDNHVLVEKEETATTTEEYGQARIDEETEKLNAEMERLNAFDVKKEKAIVQKKLDRLALIQKEIDK